MCGQQLTPPQLQATLSDGSFIGVRLEHDPQEESPLELSALIVKALAGSAAELAALHGLSLLERQGHPRVTLAAFTRLCALTLHQAAEPRKVWLHAANFPVSLEDLTIYQDLDSRRRFGREPPQFVGFDTLRNLQRITLDHQHVLDSSRRGGRAAVPQAPAALAAKLPGAHGVLRLSQHVSTLLSCTASAVIRRGAASLPKLTIMTSLFTCDTPVRAYFFD